jgi:hypothetical protein
MQTRTDALRRWVLVGGLASAACGTSIQFAPTNSPPGPMNPRPAETVQVFTSGIPKRPFVEVGVLQARQQSEWSLDGMTAIIPKLRKKAGKIGCDAVVITGSASSVVGHSADGTGHVATLEGYRAACIVFTGEAAPVATTTSDDDTAEAAAPKPSPPSGAGGFAFTMTPGEARRACQEAGHEWVDAPSQGCNGTLLDVGAPAEVRLRTCKNTLCEVRLVLRPSEDSPDWVQRFNALAQSLHARYGRIAERDLSVPEECTATPAECAVDGRARFAYRWRWDEGASVDLTLEEVDGQAALSILYRATPPPPDEESPGL